MIGFCSNAQTQFWLEDFGTNPVCGTLIATAYTGTNGAWTTSLTGVNQAFSNVWYVSPKEAGVGVGNCGDGCVMNPILIDRTLHVSTNQALFGDMGASYYAGAFGNSDIRAQSPTINCLGKSGIVLKFNYIMWAVPTQDYCEIMFSADNGVTWSGLGTPPVTPTVACAGQAKWASYTVALPATANNTATVKIGFRWQNVNATGADPSVAVDDIALTYSAAVASTLTPTFTLATSICRGDSTQVTANTGTMVASGYTWTAAPAGPLIATPNASVTWVKFPTVGTFSIFLTAQSGTQIATVNHTIVVNNTPTVNVSATSSIICAGNSTTLNAMSITPGLSYSWAPVVSVQPSVAVSPTTTSTYSVTGTNTVTGCKNTKTITITVNPNPTVNVVATNSALCFGSGNSTTLTASTSGPPLTYSWAPVVSAQPSVAVSPTVTTTYSVTGTNSVTGCKDTKTISVVINPNPTISVSSSTMNVCIGSSATLTASGGATYTWMPSGNGSTIMITPTVNTTYTVTGTSSLGCTNTTTIAITTSSCSGGSAGINAYAVNELLFSVFPNPVKDKVIIRVGDANLNNVKVELFDIVGKKLFEQSFTNLSAGTEQAIQVSNLPKGVFILQMNMDGKPQKAIRLVKE